MADCMNCAFRGNTGNGWVFCRLQSSFNDSKHMSSDIECRFKGEPQKEEQPERYKHGDIECIDAIESALTPEEFEGFCKGNIIKYVWRENHKGGKEDLKKAVWYLERLIKKGVCKDGR